MTASYLRAPHWTPTLRLAPCVCLALLLVSSPNVEAAGPPAEPETVHVVLTRGQKRLELELPRDGNVSRDTADEIARLMRCPTTGRTRRIARGTLSLLADVAARFPGHEIEVVSAVRDEPERTRDGIKHSKHYDGHAIDIIVRGAKLTEVRDAMWTNHRDIGVGWYPTGGFIHIDYRPDIHDTAWTQQRPNADNQYNPRWARVARDPSAAAAAWRAQMRRLFEANPTLATVMTSIAEAMGFSTAGIVRERRSS
jgi:uncharacterized protein YcbK (DUF882 family)